MGRGSFNRCSGFYCGNKRQERSAPTATFMSTKPMESQVSTLTVPQNPAKPQVDNKAPKGACHKHSLRSRGSSNEGP